MENHYNRRKFIKHISLAIGTTSIALPLLSFTGLSPFENLSGTKRKMGVALVGLGKYATEQLAPALQKTENCYLAGIVTGTPSKASAWQQQYNIPQTNIYDYSNFDSIADNPEIDVVYIVLPNSLHAEYTIKAALAKKHVVCEKPMATSVKDAMRMIQACKDNNVGLSIGYRLQYEPFHQRLMDWSQKHEAGKVYKVKATNSGDQTKGGFENWRLNKKLSGGGPLMDMGIYCVQAACYTYGKAPIAVTAKFRNVTKPDYFRTVEQSIHWEMDFGDDMTAECHSSYAENADSYRADAEKGWFELSPSFGYDGKQGKTNEGVLNLPNVSEQALQLDSQIQNFTAGKESLTPGEMGLRDVKILMAIYESARNGGKRIGID